MLAVLPHVAPGARFSGSRSTLDMWTAAMLSSQQNLSQSEPRLRTTGAYVCDYNGLKGEAPGRCGASSILAPDATASQLTMAAAEGT